MREIDFMAVGESHGDAICVRYGDFYGVMSTNVIDGGYSEIGQNVVDHITNIYKTNRVDNVVLTHADDDHARGLLKVMEAFEVGALRMNRPWLYVDQFIDRHHGNYTVQGLIKYIKDRHPCLVELEDIATRKGVPIYETFQGSTFGAFTVLAPTRSRYIELIPLLDKTPEVYEEADGGLVETVKQVIIGKAEEWGLETLGNNPPATSASNETSMVLAFSHDNYRAIFTGDVGPVGLAEAFLYAQSLGIPNAPNLFQIPHQGSRRNVTPAVLDAWLGYKVEEKNTYRGTAYCTVGKSKSDHPRKRVSNAFTRRGYRVQVGRGQGVVYADPARIGWDPVPAEPFWTDVSSDDESH